MDDNYHAKFEILSQRKNGFSGRRFNNVEFMHHLTNINFYIEAAALSVLSDEALAIIKDRFSFCGYGASVKGIEVFADDYMENFNTMVRRYGKKYGLKDGASNF